MGGGQIQRDREMSRIGVHDRVCKESIKSLKKNLLMISQL